MRTAIPEMFLGGASLSYGITRRAGNWRLFGAAANPCGGSNGSFLPDPGEGIKNSITYCVKAASTNQGSSVG